MLKKVIILLIIISLMYCSDNPTKSGKGTSEPDSTSHEIVWETDTLGTFQSTVGGIWGTDENNVYAAGGFYLKDNQEFEGTSIFHWNGNKWNPLDHWIGTLNAIFGFSDNNIWAVGGNGAQLLITHWNGVKWDTWKSPVGVSGSLTGVWGPNPDNIYAVGGYLLNGIDGNERSYIYHCSDGNITQMLSPFNLPLYDIWGINDTTIYACGGYSGYGYLLKYDGNEWEIIFEGNYIDDTQPSGFVYSVWGFTEDKIHIETSSGTFIGYENNWNPSGAPKDNTRISRIRGNSNKNIFYVGAFGLIIHWNGKSWHRYDEIYAKPNGNNLYTSWMVGDKVFIGGRFTEDSNAIVYRGTMIN
jgi:hypothetical protein